MRYLSEWAGHLNRSSVVNMSAEKLSCKPVDLVGGFRRHASLHGYLVDKACTDETRTYASDSVIHAFLFKPPLFVGELKKAFACAYLSGQCQGIKRGLFPSSDGKQTAERGRPPVE